MAKRLTSTAVVDRHPRHVTTRPASARHSRRQNEMMVSMTPRARGGVIPVNPIWTTEPQYTIPNSSKGHGRNGGFRETFIDDHMREASIKPGPGAFKWAQEIPTPSSQDRSSQSARLSNSTTLSTSFRRSRISTSDTINASRVCFEGQEAHKFTKEARNVSVPDLRMISSAQLPTNVMTPGPGAYMQEEGFKPVRNSRSSSRSSLRTSGVQTPRSSTSRLSNRLSVLHALKQNSTQTQYPGGQEQSIST